MTTVSEWTLRREALAQAISVSVENGDVRQDAVLATARSFRDFLADEEEADEEVEVVVNVVVEIDGEPVDFDFQ